MRLFSWINLKIRCVTTKNSHLHFGKRLWLAFFCLRGNESSKDIRSQRTNITCNSKVSGNYVCHIDIVFTVKCSHLPVLVIVLIDLSKTHSISKNRKRITLKILAIISSYNFFNYLEMHCKKSVQPFLDYTDKG